MAFSTHEQFFTMLERSERPLIVLTQNPNADDFASAFGVSTLLTKLQKPVEIVSAGGRAPKSVAFLNVNIPINEDLKHIRKMTIKLNAKNASVDELSYAMQGDELHIHILPKNGHWNHEDVKVVTDAFRYDLIIAIGGQDMESFGDIFTKYKEFFFKTPVINIDHNQANEHYGQANIVDMSAVSCSEVCYNLFCQIDDSLIDADVATYLLTGMIFKTKSFRSESVTPGTLKTAGELITKGARRDEIVQNLYKTRNVETLRLWGRALARLKADKEHFLVWTLLTKQDFANAGAAEEALEDILGELIMSAPEAKIATLIFERPDNSIAVMLNAKRPFDALHLGAPFRVAGTREEALLKMRDNNIVDAERAVISHIKEQVEISSRI